MGYYSSVADYMGLSLVVTLAVSLTVTVFEILTHKARKWLVFSLLPCLTLPLGGGDPSEFLDETYPAKTTRMGLPCGANFIILTSTIF